ncbi:hypothetical protein [Botrimarina sp.]|uniref:hypothetical protein n=1 Tax=Botrimarina sp. TaxID=2795802 RepID=UPI0032EBDB16
MNPCDLDSGASRIVRGLKDLNAVWEEASEQWNDSVSEAVHKRYVEPIGPVVKSTLDAVGRMRQLLQQAQRDLED